MSIFNVFSLMGGLAFFLFGMHIMSGSLEKIAGGRLEATLKKMTSNPFKSLLLGAGITIAIQSSSAMTVMLVGLLYKMCKLRLVIPAKTEGALNRVDMDGAENRRSDAKMILRKIHESETKTEE